MASPVFDKEQYELRGKYPLGLTTEQRDAIETAIARVNGQLDWNAQLVGFNGTNYWGERIPTSDGTYKWKGLPETVFEKRSTLTTAFGVYNKDKEYLSRPSPFNRTDVKAAADQIFDIYENGDRTLIVPFGQPRSLPYEKNPRLVVGGEYTFNALVSVETSNGAGDALYIIQDIEQQITSVRILSDATTSIFIRREGSSAKPFLFFIIPWSDCSDWLSNQVLEQFIGVWGNKGNAISSDALFDALNIHGFNEAEGLVLDDITSRITLQELLSYVGLVPGPATAITTSHYNFEIRGCLNFFEPSVIPGAPEQFGSCSNPNFNLNLTQKLSDEPTQISTDPGPENSIPIGCNGVEYLFPLTCTIDNDEYEAPLGQFYLNGGDYDFPVIYTDSVNDGIYDRDPLTNCDGIPEDFERIIDFDDLVTDFNGQPGPILMTDPGQFNETVLAASGLDYDGFELVFDGPELAAIEFDYTAVSQYGTIAFPCIEWVFDPTLDNSTYWPIAPESAWMGTDDGEYDRPAIAKPLATQSINFCDTDSPSFFSFDDGIFDKIVSPNCDLTLESLNPCEEDIDSGYYDPPFNPFPPPDNNADCRSECGVIDGGVLTFGTNSTIIEDLVVDGGEVGFCAIYDNSFYDENIIITTDCDANNGTFEDAPPADSIDDGQYDRAIDPFCLPCSSEANQQPIPCPVDPIRIRLDKIIFSSPAWRMCPSVVNSMTPLRLWKNRVLNTYDPELDNAFINPLIADENTGPENIDSYRHFARLPIEYNRNGKFWNRTEAVLANQSYFSRLQPPASTALPVIDEKPLLYDEIYQVSYTDLPDDATFYVEDYLVSNLRDVEIDDQSGFVGAKISYEPPASTRPYIGATIIEYDAYQHRLLTPTGARVGSYLKWSRKSPLTGFLESDTEKFRLRYTDDSESVVSDSAEILIPNQAFPDDSNTASFANYVVCYAYFVADISAADDPVFDPASLYNWRNDAIDNIQPLEQLLATNREDLILTSDFEYINLADDGTTTAGSIPTFSRYIKH
jgi:hypothetical protein